MSGSLPPLGGTGACYRYFITTTFVLEVVQFVRLIYLYNNKLRANYMPLFFHYRMALYGKRSI